LNRCLAVAGAVIEVPGVRVNWTQARVTSQTSTRGRNPADEAPACQSRHASCWFSNAA